MLEKIITETSPDSLKVGAGKINGLIDITRQNFSKISNLDIESGKNLFNKKSVLNNIFIDEVNKVIKQGSGYFTSSPIKVEASTTYLIYASDNRYIASRCAFLDLDFKVIDAMRFTSGAIQTITSPENAMYLVVCDSINLIRAIDLMVEKGTKTNYERFKMTIPYLRVGLKDVDFVKIGKNLYNINTAESGKYIDQNNLTYQSNVGHVLSNIIDIEEGESYTISGNVYGIRVAFFNDNGMSSAVISDTVPYTFSIPKGITRIQFSYGYKSGALVQLEKGSVATEYEDYKIIIDNLSVPQKEFENATGTLRREFPKITKVSVLANEKIIAESENTAINGDLITYFANITSPFTSLKVGNGETVGYGSFVEVTSTEIITNILGATGNVEEVARVSHNFTPKDYIQVTIQHIENGRVNVTASTNGGSRKSLKNRWLGRRGEIFAKCDVSTKNVTLSYSNIYADKAIYAFGDSFFDLVSPSRWPYYIINTYGIDNVLYDGFGGRNSADGYQGFRRALKYGKPKYALWALGMNDPDTTKINSSYQFNVNNFINDCKTFGITPILATIPTTPTMQNDYKNAFIRSSGYRYIDFDKAVRIENTREWYSGMLNPDNVHPDEAGAKALADRVLADFPEIQVY